MQFGFKKNCSITRLYWIIPPESFRGSQLNSVGTTQKDINMRKGRVGSRGFVRGGREIKENGDWGNQTALYSFTKLSKYKLI